LLIIQIIKGERSDFIAILYTSINDSRC